MDVSRDSSVETMKNVGGEDSYVDKNLANSGNYTSLLGLRFVSAPAAASCFSSLDGPISGNHC